MRDFLPGMVAAVVIACSGLMIAMTAYTLSTRGAIVAGMRAELQEVRAIAAATRSDVRALRRELK